MQYTMGPVTSHPLTLFQTIIAHSVEKLSTIESCVPWYQTSTSRIIQPFSCPLMSGPQLQTVSFCTYIGTINYSHAHAETYIPIYTYTDVHKHIHYTCSRIVKFLSRQKSATTTTTIIYNRMKLILRIYFTLVI